MALALEMCTEIIVTFSERLSLDCHAITSIALTPFSFIFAGIWHYFFYVHLLESTSSSVTVVSEAADLLRVMPPPSTIQNYSRFQARKCIADFSSPITAQKLHISASASSGKKGKSDMKLHNN